VAQYGTGANFAVRKAAVLAIGGFDEGMGIGSPTGGGEDIDLFIRILVAGQILAREPSAIVWHRHRRTAEELAVQIRNYGLGLGAWATKLVLRPRTLGMVLLRLGPGIRHLRAVTVVDQTDTVDNDPGLEALNKQEVNGVLNGPFALARARLTGRKAMPLKKRDTQLARAFDFRGDQMWGDSGSSIAAGRLALTAVVISLLGSLGAIDALPSFVLGLVVGAFVLGGPGSLIMSWFTHLQPIVVAGLVLLLSVAVCILVVSGLLMAGTYRPTFVLLSLTIATMVIALARCHYLARRVAEPQP
jgi:hypothetical protein